MGVHVCHSTWASLAEKGKKNNQVECVSAVFVKSLRLHPSFPASRNQCLPCAAGPAKPWQRGHGRACSTGHTLRVCH